MDTDQLTDILRLNLNLASNLNGQLTLLRRISTLMWLKIYDKHITIHVVLKEDFSRFSSNSEAKA